MKRCQKQGERNCFKEVFGLLAMEERMLEWSGDLDITLNKHWKDETSPQ